MVAHVHTGLFRARPTSRWVAVWLLVPSLAVASPMAHLLRLAPTGEGPGDQFGIIVGGPGDLNADGFPDIAVSGFLNDAGGIDCGRAYVYFGGPIMSTTPSMVLTGEGPGDNFGAAKGAGDVNGDGYRDLIVGANQAGLPSPGKAYIYFGGPSMDSVPDVIFTGEHDGDLFGSRVATAGDINEDGYDDVIIGAIATSTHGYRTGSAYLYFGGPSMDDIPDMVFTGETAGDEFGLVAPAGDINGDGHQDIIIGAWIAASEAGRAYLYFGGPGMDNVPDEIFTGEAPGDRLGVSVMGSGDVNGDGHPDVIVGAFWNDANGPNAGRAYVYFGGPAMDTVPDVVLTGEAVGDGFGKSVCDAGDVNHDGFADVIVGAYQSDAGGYNSGKAYVFFGGNPMDSTPDMTITGEAAGDQMGYWVSSTGDLFGDGFPDVVVGASFNDASAVDAGRAYVTDFNRYFVQTPNGGEHWVSGGFGYVSWLGAEPADIWLSADNGMSYQRIVSGVGGKESNGVVIPVPSVTSTLARIKLTPTNPQVTGRDVSDAVFQIVPGTTGVTPGESQQPSFAPVLPNPVADAARLRFELPREATVTVSVFDMRGRRVATPIGGERLPAGQTSRTWRPSSLPPGVYEVRARIGAFEQARRAVWLGDR